MATIFLTGPEQLASELLSLTGDRGIRLTAHAENLIRLSASAWFTDLRLRNTRENPRELARRIVEMASKERHVRNAQQLEREVDFFSWFHALGKSGEKVLRTIFDKGF